MLFCDQCGRENRRGARFCSFCGKIISNDQSPSAPVLKSMSDNPINASEAPTLIEEPLLSPIPVQPNEEVAATLPGEPLLNTLVPEEDVSTSGILIEVSPTGEISSPNGTPSIHTGTISMPYTGKTVPLSLLPLQNQEDILDSGVSTGEILSQITPEFSPFEVLPDGTMLQGRYKLLNGEWEGETILYQAEDMLTCWNCHAVQTESDSTFCEACGAEMVPKISLFLRASRPTGEVSGSEAAENRFVENGTTYHVEPQAIQAPAKSEPTQVQLVYGYRTDTGRGRNNNEDSLLAIHLVGLCELQCSPTLGFFAVADGVGGYAGGEVASHSIVRSLGQSILQNIFISELNAPSLLKEGLADQLRMAVLGANQAVIEAHQTSSSETEMESTLTAALVRERTAVIANVGDSRTYIMRQGHLTQLTKDHSVVARLVEQGTLSPKEIYTHEQRNIIFRTLGENPDVEVDIFTIELEPGDRLLLCSDGLWEMVHDPYIEDVLLECSDPQQACDKLVDMANLAGGDDNISLIVINLQV